MEKKYIPIILFLLIVTLQGVAQNLKENSKSSKVTLLVLDLKKTTFDIDNFIIKYEIIPSAYIKNKNKLEIEFTTTNEIALELTALFENWGYVESETNFTENHTEELDKINSEIELLQKEHKQYKSLVKGVDSSANDKYFKYWEKIIELESKIATINMEKEKILAEINTVFIELYIYEEASTDMYAASWVNMPGFEYSLLKTEQPLEGFTPEIMHGLSLKYMFNTGKSYGVIGLYKKAGESNFISEIDETYIFALGQDFYSKRMGRGQHKSLNLYTSFNAGVYISTSENSNIASWFVNPFLGVELFKSRYFLIDNKVGYFLPFKNNRTQRGLLYNASFNFVF